MTVRMVTNLIPVLVFCLAIPAQTLQIPPSTVKAGGASSFVLRFDSGQGPAAVALQWRFSLPGGISVNPADISAGSAAESAQKSLTCVPADDSKGKGYACVLAGGKQALRSGPLALVFYRVDRVTSQIPGKIRVDNALAVTLDAKKIEIPSAEGVIKVQ